jgi:hypothetical protein
MTLDEEKFYGVSIQSIRQQFLESIGGAKWINFFKLLL